MSDRIDTNEWRNNSYKGLVCGIMLCRNSPIKQCPRCFFIIAPNMLKHIFIQQKIDPRHRII